MASYEDQQGQSRAIEVVAVCNVMRVMSVSIPLQLRVMNIGIDGIERIE
jgi:hypothetical protein